MAPAAPDPSTLWMWLDEAVVAATMVTRSPRLAQHEIRKAILAGKLRWGGELSGHKRPTDPGVDDPELWRRPHQGVVLEIRWDECRLRRREYERGHRGPLCDYIVSRIRVLREDMATIELLPPPALATLATREAPDTASFAGTVRRQAALVASEAPDTLAFTGSVLPTQSVDGIAWLYAEAERMIADDAIERMIATGNLPARGAWGYKAKLAKEIARRMQVAARNDPTMHALDVRTIANYLADADTTWPPGLL